MDETQTLIAPQNQQYQTIGDVQADVSVHLDTGSQRHRSKEAEDILEVLHWLFSIAGVVFTGRRWVRVARIVYSFVCFCLMLAFLVVQFVARAKVYPEETTFSFFTIAMGAMLTYIVPWLLCIRFLNGRGLSVLLHEAFDAFELQNAYRERGHVASGRMRSDIVGGEGFHGDADLSRSNIMKPTTVIKLHFLFAPLVILLLTAQWAYIFWHLNNLEKILGVLVALLSSFCAVVGISLFSVICVLHRQLILALVNRLRWNNIDVESAVQEVHLQSRLLRNSVMISQTFVSVFIVAQVFDILANIFNIVESGLLPSSIRTLQLSFGFINFICVDILLGSWILVSASRVTSGFRRIVMVVSLLRAQAGGSSYIKGNGNGYVNGYGNGTQGRNALHTNTNSHSKKMQTDRERERARDRISELDSFLGFLNSFRIGMTLHGVYVDTNLISKLIFTGLMVALVTVRLAVNTLIVKS